MIPSAEVRWFGAGSVPESVAAWFQSLGGPTSEEARTDRYLAPTDQALNVKLRAGQLEVKRRRAVGAPRLELFGIAADAEKWQKWGFEVQEAEQPGDATWHDVTKYRRSLTYEVSPSGEVAAVGHRPARGCDLELTRVERAGEPWWTVCFEAFGEAAVLIDTLQAALAHAKAQQVPPSQPHVRAYGYAAWLLGFEDTA